MMKKALVLTVFAVMMVGALLAGCGGSKTQETTPSGQGQQGGGGEKVFTVEELARYDGKNGQPAYIAVDGVVYDMTGSSLWPQGEHQPCSLASVAGKDLSGVIKQAPANMRTNLKRFPVVGRMQ